MSAPEATKTRTDEETPPAVPVPAAVPLFDWDTMGARRSRTTPAGSSPSPIQPARSRSPLAERGCAAWVGYRRRCWPGSRRRVGLRWIVRIGQVRRCIWRDTVVATDGWASRCHGGHTGRGRQNLR